MAVMERSRKLSYIRKDKFPFEVWRIYQKWLIYKIRVPAPPNLPCLEDVLAKTIIAILYHVFKCMRLIWKVKKNNVTIDITTRSAIIYVVMINITLKYILFKEETEMALKNLFGKAMMAAPAACGSACGAGDKKEEKPAACGSACGTGDKK